TELDRAAEKLLTMVVTPEEATRKLYGEVYHNFVQPVSVYVAASCKDIGKPYSRAGFGVYWGPADARNTAIRINEASESRAALLAVLHVVLAVPRDRSVVIYTSSHYAIRSFCYWAGEYATSGWLCAHGDVLRDAATAIQQRTAPLRFYPLKAEPNVHAQSAQKLAREATS
ncbi:hypothetical protein C8F04DRAFT_894162, partial [Mycena alexandri]